MITWQVSTSCVYVHGSVPVNVQAFLKLWEKRAKTFWEVKEILTFKVAGDFSSSIGKITSSGFINIHKT